MTSHKEFSANHEASALEIPAQPQGKMVKQLHQLSATHLEFWPWRCARTQQKRFWNWSSNRKSLNHELTCKPLCQIVLIFVPSLSVVIDDKMSNCNLPPAALGLPGSSQPASGPCKGMYRSNSNRGLTCVPCKENNIDQQKLIAVSLHAWIDIWHNLEVLVETFAWEPMMSSPLWCWLTPHKWGYRRWPWAPGSEPAPGEKREDGAYL